MDNKPLLLEDHVDLPIKKCVAMLNLLGIRTLWSCCGFNYEGQPEWKDHVYGTPHVYLSLETPLPKLVYIMSQSSWDVKIAFVSCTVAYQLYLPYNRKDIWTNPNSVHYHEHGNVAIKKLELALLPLREQMVNEVTLLDENEKMAEIYEHWQYKPSAPWIIKKSEFILDKDTEFLKSAIKKTETGKI